MDPAQGAAALGVSTPSEDAANTEATGAEAPSPVLTVDEVAVLLRLNRKTVYQALARGEIPGALRIGRSYRIARSALLAWLADGQVRGSRSRRNP